MLEALETAKERLRSRLFRRAEFQSLEAKRGDSNTAGKTRGSMPFPRRTSLEISLYSTQRTTIPSSCSRCCGVSALDLCCRADLFSPSRTSLDEKLFGVDSELLSMKDPVLVRWTDSTVIVQPEIGDTLNGLLKPPRVGRPQSKSPSQQRWR